MDRNYHGDFEEFLKQKADHYKLYPSDNVWKGIYRSLHTRKTWFRVGGSFLFLTAIVFISQQVNLSATSGVKAGRQPQVADHYAVSARLSPATVPASRNTTRLSATLPEQQPNVDGQTVNVATLADVVSRPEEAIKQDETVYAANRPIDQHKTPDQPIAAETVGAAPVPEENFADVAMARVGDVHEEKIQETVRGEVNWLQEMAVIQLAPKTGRRMNLQFYFSPLVTYRKLSATSRDLKNTPLALSHHGIGSFVDHTPAVGVEIGSNLLVFPYKNLTLKTGLQLNYSRYNIRAYQFYYEKARIALMPAGRVNDTITSLTPFRNFSGYSPQELQNQYVQVSLPLGAELKLLGNKKFQFSVAGSIQPTYLLYNDAYLLSTDLINYTREPSLVRKWNLNTSAEAFVSYKAGKLRWQIGPQFRYQTLSSYNDRYPIKEYLMEYGIKFGLSKTLK